MQTTVYDRDSGKELKKYEKQPRVNLKHCYSFEIVKEKSYKLYMPEPAFRFYGGKDAKTAFLPNLDAATNAYGKDYAYETGVNELEVGKPAILCGGESDLMALKWGGLNAFTDGAESGLLSLHTLRRLKEKKIPKLSVLYDTDYTGLSSAHSFKKWMEEVVKEQHSDLYIPTEIIDLPGMERQEYKKKDNGKIYHYKDTQNEVETNQLPTPFNENIPPYRKPPENDFCDFVKRVKAGKINSGTVKAFKKVLKCFKKKKLPRSKSIAKDVGNKNIGAEEDLKKAKPPPSLSRKPVRTKGSFSHSF